MVTARLLASYQLLFLVARDGEIEALTPEPGGGCIRVGVRWPFYGMDFNSKTDNIEIPAMLGAVGKQNACLVVIAGQHSGQLHRLNENEITIGRGDENQIVIKDDAVSRRHAVIARLGPKQFELRDLGSTNGTFCNGERVKNLVLSDGDKVSFGTTAILKFSFQDDLDVTFQERLFSSVVRDWMTGCYNKRYLKDHIGIEFAAARRQQQPLSLVILDIDFFKRVNDMHGHLVGDYVIKAVAESVNKTLRAEEVLARFGGEEFVILTRNADSKSAEILAERCRGCVEQGRYEYEGIKVAVTISLGVATYFDGDPSTPEALLARADAALYRAKKKGKNRVEIHRRESAPEQSDEKENG